MKLTFSQAYSKINEIDEFADLTIWEEDFLDSISKQLENGGELTERQEQTLENIYEKYCC